MDDIWLDGSGHSIRDLWVLSHSRCDHHHTRSTFKLGQDPSKLEYSLRMLHDLFHQANQDILLHTITALPFDFHSLGELLKHVKEYSILDISQHSILKLFIPFYCRIFNFGMFLFHFSNSFCFLYAHFEFDKNYNFQFLN